jgi:hypothetical protein
MEKLYQKERDIKEQYNNERSKNLAEHLDRMDKIEQEHLSNMYIQQKEHEYNMWKNKQEYEKGLNKLYNY